MLFLIELDHVKSGTMLGPEAGQAFIEKIIFPTLTRAEELVKEEKILAGGTVLGRVALRFIAQADSLQEMDLIISSLPIWTVAETRVTPLIGLDDRRSHVQKLLERVQELVEKPQPVE